MATYWADLYREHFQRYFQKPFDVQVFHEAHGGASLKLATYDGAMEGFRVYASMGLADRLANDEDDVEIAEAILYCDVPDPVAPRLFVNALFFILREGIPVDSRFAIGFGGDFTWRGKTALYFTRARGPDEHFDKLRHGETFGRVVQAYFLTPEEDDFLGEHGVDAFEQRLFEGDEPRLSVRRPSCV